MVASIDTLLRLVPDSPQTVLTHLTSHPQLASTSDSNGYSLLHAASSYNQLPLLRTLVNTYHVSPNIPDGEGDTPLFFAETLEAAKCLVEELNADFTIKNAEGITAETNALASDEGAGEWALVAGYLKGLRTGENAQGTTAQVLVNGNLGQASAAQQSSGDNGGANDIHPPPPLPRNVRINMGTMHDESQAEGDAPDPEFRRRIEELAARDDFQTELGQRELKNLVTEAVGGLAADNGERNVRRRL